jgi:hypothetical protein
MLSNLRFVREKGIRQFMRQQERRITLLETMIEGYDDGRSRSFFCRAAALLDPKALKGSLNEAEKAVGAGGGRTSDKADRAKVLRGILAEAALSEGIELTGKRLGEPPHPRTR